MLTTKYTLEVEEDDQQDANENLEKTSSVRGWYTLDSEGKYCEDKKYIKYLHMPESTNVRFDLNKTHEADVHKPQDKMSESIQDLLKWVTLHSVDAEGKPKLPDVDFLCYRGLLSRLMWTPYEKSESLMLCAVRLRNTTYLCQFATEQNKENMKKMSSREMSKFSRCGFKFEQYMLADSPNETPDTDKPLSELEEMCCIFCSQIGQHKIMYGAEVDGLPNEDALADLSNAKLVELKTCKENPSEYSFKRYKMLKWWAQSWLVNIDTVVVGYRDDDYTVNRLEEIKVGEMPTLAKRFWSARTCTKFLEDFLNFVKYVMQDSPNDDAKAVYRFEWSPNANYGAVNDFTGLRLPANHECNFIPDWYTEWLNSIPE